ncbi:MAG: SAF domain-containing protein, partial [Patescibacteria group bacterium]
AENVIFRKSLFVVENIKKGEKFTHKNVRSVRPGHGLEPKYFEQIIGEKAAQSIERGEPLNWKTIGK